METWMLLWKIVLIGGLSLFGLMAVWVTIWGGKRHQKNAPITQRGACDRGYPAAAGIDVRPAPLLSFTWAERGRTTRTGDDWDILYS